MADKGKGIAQSSNEDSLKMIMPIIEQGGSTSNLSILKQFRTHEEGPMTIKEVAFQLQETNRLADLKAVKDKSEEALRSDQLLKTPKAKFKWVATPANKLNIPPSHQLTEFELLLAERKRKRTTEILKEVFIFEDVVVDGMHTNLTPPKGITSTNFGQVIEKPEVRILYYNGNFDLVFQRRNKDRYNADIRATNILLQRLPKDIYSLINHYTDEKDIWDNHKGETIHDYYVRFAKLINDMRNIKMTMSRMQLNSKFVNNMFPEWDRFVTAVKLNRGLRDSNYDQLYAYLKQHEAHANENKMMFDRFTHHTVDPLALMSNVTPQQYNSQSSRNPSSTYVPPHFANNSQLDSGLSLTDNLIENLTNTLALLTQSYKAYLPQTRNQLRTSSNPRNQATVQDGRVVVQNVQGRQNREQGNNARGAGTASYEGAQNRVGNDNPGQAR
ncbi:hypothetical protein Tco_0400607 [Tanacetum coccineum]